LDIHDIHIQHIQHSSMEQLCQRATERRIRQMVQRGNIMKAKSCDGCDYEMMDAITAQDEGLHYATSTDQEYWDGEHFFIWMVDDNGKEQIW
jgi:hypothetical protein